MPLFHSEVYDAFREIGISHEKALAAAVALYTSPPAPNPSLPLIPLSTWPFALMVVLVGACLFFAGYVVCQQEHVYEQAARSRALIERLHPSPQP